MAQHEEEVEEEETAPFWVISFSDMMTLLLTFFIMLFSMSTIEKTKLEGAAESLRAQFGGALNGSGGIFDGGSFAPSRKKPTGRANRLIMLQGQSPLAGGPGEAVKIKTLRSDEEALDGGIVRFALGSDELTETAKARLAGIYTLLAGLPSKILVKGHADAEEKGPFQNADDLAYSRACNVREYLISLGLKRSAFQVSVVGPYEPLLRKDVPGISDTRELNAYVGVFRIAGLLADGEEEEK